MLKNLVTLTFLATSICGGTWAQRQKTEPVNYTYLQLPMKPVDKSISNYQSTVFPEYQKDNDAKKAAYDAELALARADYDRAMREYPNTVAAAKAKYDADLKAYNEKSLAEKVIEKQVLNENSKPVYYEPPAPQLRFVQEPNYQRTYDYQALASTYITLDGFQNAAPNALQIRVVLFGYEYTNPRTVSEVKQVSSIKNGTSTTSNVTYYHLEFTYRHTMSVRVTDASGKEILFLTPAVLNNYTKFQTPANTTAPTMDVQTLIRSKEEEILQKNLTIIQNLVNDEIGYKRQARTANLTYIKDKKDIYTDLLIAFNDASSGLKVLLDDEETAKTKLQAAVEGYEKALLESDLNDRKARIDEEVTKVIYFNLLECYFAMGNLQKAEAIITTLNTMQIGNDERKLKDSYEKLINDTKKRIAANK